MLTGDYDYLTTPEMTKETAEQIKGAEFIEMKGIGHFPMSENPPMCNQFFAQALDIIEKRIS
jgi:pimeloyl-ACP methyl ester carboxylesterase